MEPVTWVIVLAVGAFGGWLAGLSTEHGGVGWLGNATVGVGTGALGGWLLATAMSVPLMVVFVALFVSFVASIVVLTVVERVRSPRRIK